MIRLIVLALAGAVIAATPATAREYLKAERAQSRGFSPGVVTEGGKTVWISGQTGLVDEQGKSMAGDFEGRARVIFRAVSDVPLAHGDADYQRQLTDYTRNTPALMDRLLDRLPDILRAIRSA